MSQFLKPTWLLMTLVHVVMLGCAHGTQNENATTPQAPNARFSTTCEDTFLKFEDDEVLAEVNGEVITGKDINEDIDADATQTWRTYCETMHGLRSDALEKRVRIALIEAAARKASLSLGEWLENIQAEAQKPTDEQVEQFYKDEVPNGVPPLEDIREEVVTYLSQKLVQEHLEATLGALYEGAVIKKTMPSVAPPAIAFSNPPGAPTLGMAKAPVVITIFSDFECPYCTKMAEIINEVLQARAKKVRAVFRHFPLSFHPNAFDAAVFATCAHHQNGFQAFHDALFTQAADLSRKGLWLLAEAQGLDRDQMEACVNSDGMREVVEFDVAEGRRMGVRGTPTLYINGAEYRGDRTAGAIIEHIDRLEPK